jgi:hypothetical protein
MLQHLLIVENMDNFNKDVIKCIETKQWPLTPNLQTRALLVQIWQGKSHFSQKWPLANVCKSGESVTAFWQIWQIFKLGCFMYKKDIFRYKTI